MKPPLASPADVNPIPSENALPGDSGWNNQFGANTANLAAYPDRISAALGETLNFYVASDSVACTAKIYRLGWYGGAGGRLLQTVTFNATNKLANSTLTASYSMGGALGVPLNMVTTQYDVGFSLTIPATWLSGFYLALVTRANGSFPQMVPFLVTNPRSQSQLVMMVNDTTWQAYNTFGAYSIYQGATGFSAQVSYDRPFGSLGNWYNWEIPMLRWLEQNGYDVTYVAAKDVDADPLLLRRHAVAVTAGHSEYWSQRMWNHWVKARDHGTALGFFCANTAYKRIRWLPSTQGTGPQRVFACYEHFPWADPLGKMADRAGRSQWHGNWANALAGVGYGTLCTGTPNVYPFVCADATHWAFAGTGMATNDTIPGIMGYEIDVKQPTSQQTPTPSPAGLQTLGASPVTGGGADLTAHTTYYLGPNGNGVFGSGTISWSWGLDNWVLDGGTPRTSADSRLQQITTNVLARLGSTGKPSAT